MKKYAWTNKDICQCLGIKPTQVIHLAELGIITPEIEMAGGRGSVRRYSLANVIAIGIFQELLRAGTSFNNARDIMGTLKRQNKKDFTRFDVILVFPPESSVASAPWHYCLMTREEWEVVISGKDDSTGIGPGLRKILLDRTAYKIDVKGVRQQIEAY